MKVSIIIPSFNRAGLVGETIDNMLAQSWKDKEIIVVDDGSTDNTPEVLESYGDRIRVYRQGNKGVGAARNLGLEHAKGEFIQFMDSDDLAIPRKIENQIHALEKGGADIVCGPWVKARLNGHKLIPVDQVLQQGPPPSHVSTIEWLNTAWSIILQNCLFRRSLIQKVGMFREDWKIAEDQDFFLRCLLAGAKLGHCPQSLTIYRLHDAEKLTTSGTSKDRKISDWAQYLLASRKLLLNSGFPIDPVKWFGFRIRLWANLRELNQSGNPEFHELAKQIAALLKGYPEIHYRIKSLWGRAYRGFQFRTRGSRYHRCFSTAKINGYQSGELALMGYRIETVKPELFPSVSDRGAGGDCRGKSGSSGCTEGLDRQRSEQQPVLPPRRLLPMVRRIDESFSGQ